MSDTIDPVDIAKGLAEVERFKRIHGEAPKAEPPEPKTPGEKAARAIARNREQQERWP